MQGFNYKTKFTHIAQNGNGWTYTYFTDQSKTIRHSEVAKYSAFGRLAEGKMYYPSGALKTIFSVNAEDQLQGRYTEMWENGSTKITSTYINGNLQGYQTTFYQGSTQIHEMTQYACNKRHGTHREHYISGRIKLEATFKDDNPVGMFKVKYDNEQNNLMIFCSFTESGVIDGEFKVFSENGEPQITMFYNHRGECTNKVELNDFKMSEQCKQFFDHIIQFNDVNKTSLKTTSTVDFDKVWDDVLNQPPPNGRCGSPPLLTYPSATSTGTYPSATSNGTYQSGYYSGHQTDYHSGYPSATSTGTYQSGYQSGYTGHTTVYNADYWKTLNATRETEYESELAKAIEESRSHTENTTVATVSFRSLIEAHRDEQTATHDAMKEKDPLMYLQEMCMPWFVIENKILTGQ
jgi:antitoxin component YwqK of YwqJK toxin-antitoxin module